MGHCLRNFFATCLAGSDLGSDLISLRSDQIIAVSCQTIVCSLPKDEAKIGFSSKMVLGRLCIIFLLARFSSGLHRFVLTMNANYFRLLVTAAVLILCSLPAVKGDEDQSSQDVAIRQLPTVDGEVFLLPYFLGNGETGVYFAASQDGLKFQWLNQGEVVLPAPDWGEESLTRDPSILFHDGVFHLVWTTSWNSQSIGYARSKDLLHWSQPKKIVLWGAEDKVRNTWAPELHHDDQADEFFVLWSSTTEQELRDGDGSEDTHGYDHRSYASRTKDFVTWSAPSLFYSPESPEIGVIDPFIACDDRSTEDQADDRWVMVIKNEMSEAKGGKNLRLAFAGSMQGPFGKQLGPPIVGAGTKIVNSMAEGPSLLKRGGLWWLYWDAPGSKFSYCLATSDDLRHWVDRSPLLQMPADQMRHGTVLAVPKHAVSRLVSGVHKP